MNSLKLWLTLRIHGREAYEQHIDRQIQLGRWFADQVRRSANFELFCEPMLPIFNLRLKKISGDQSERLERIVGEVTREGKQWISTTRVNGQTVIRVMIISYLTQQSNLQELLSRLDWAARR
jgi:aromatic-L-amino-acid decarboxylase